MAKEKEKTVVNEVMNADNVMDIVSKGNRADAVIVDKVLDDIQKEKDETKARAIKNRILKADYKTTLSLIDVRRERRNSELVLEKLRRIGNLKRFMLGFTVDDTFMQHNKCKTDTCELDVPDGKGGTIKRKFKKGEVVEPLIDYVDWDTLYSKICDDIADKRQEVDKIFRAEQQKVQASYGSYYNWDWER